MVRKRFGVLAGLVAALLTVSPTAAIADPAPVSCKVGIVLPAKLALTGATAPYGVRLTGDTTCFSYVPWDVSQGLISTGQVIQFWAPNTSGFFTYLGTPAKVHALPRQGGYSLVKTTDPVTGVVKTYTVAQSGSNTMTVKYDSRIAWRPVKRIGSRLQLRAAVAAISDTTRYTGSYAAWPHAKIRFQHRTSTGAWRTVAATHASSTGVAAVDVPFQAGAWRAVSVDSATTWGRATSSHTIKPRSS